MNYINKIKPYIDINYVITFTHLDDFINYNYYNNLNPITLYNNYQILLKLEHDIYSDKTIEFILLQNLIFAKRYYFRKFHRMIKRFIYTIDDFDIKYNYLECKCMKMIQYLKHWKLYKYFTMDILEYKIFKEYQKLKYDINTLYYSVILFNKSNDYMILKINKLKSLLVIE